MNANILKAAGVAIVMACTFGAGILAAPAAPAVIATAAPAASQVPTPAPNSAPAVTATAGPRVNLNTASAEELDALPGIGEKTAERIIAARPIASVDAVAGLPGVRPTNLAKFKDLVTV